MQNLFLLFHAKKVRYLTYFMMFCLLFAGSFYGYKSLHVSHKNIAKTEVKVASCKEFKTMDIIPNLDEITVSRLHVDYVFVNGKLKNQKYRQTFALNGQIHKNTVEKLVMKKIKTKSEEYIKLCDVKKDHHLIVYMVFLDSK